MPVTQIMTVAGRTFVPGPSLVNLMTLDAANYSGSGTTWPDTSGTSHPGELVNSPTYANTIPKHFTFDRSSLQYVQGPTLDTLTNWTIESWFRLTEPLSNTEATALITTTYALTYDENVNYTWINFCLGNNGPSAGTPYLKAGFFNPYAGGWNETSGFIPEVGTWYHVICTWDGSYLRQWVNGQFNSEAQATIPGGGGPVRIARRWDGETVSQHYFPGDVGLVKIFSGAMSNTDITSAWNTTKSTYGY